MLQLLTSQYTGGYFMGQAPSYDFDGPLFTTRKICKIALGQGWVGLYTKLTVLYSGDMYSEYWDVSCFEMVSKCLVLI